MEEAEIEVQIKVAEEEAAVVEGEERLAVNEANADATTSLQEIQAIEDEEVDDELIEEIEQAEIDVVIEEEEAVLAEKEADDI